MSVREEIDKAISAHGQWKDKLRLAIDTGVCESTPEKVRQDNNCSFGKWLHYRLDESAKANPYYHDVVELHASFHREAGAILELALAGNKAAATEALHQSSKFSIYSTQLIFRMREWQASLPND